MILKNATLISFVPPHVEQSDLAVDGGSVTRRARSIRRTGQEETVDLSGMLIMPGMVNAHTHLYSALARGMGGPQQPPVDFVDILRKIWWRLDQSLDEESIYYSALVGSIEALKHGTTVLVDHHASPHCITGSLDIIKQAMSAVGLRGILCYETTDRGGRRRRDEGLAENDRFIAENANNPHFRGTMGAHASFTLDDDTMRMLGDLAAIYDCGVHIHVAEDRADVEDARRRMSGGGLVARLRTHGLLTRKSICAHGVHLTRHELRHISRAGAWLVHNPRSNMNNAVGYAPLSWFGPRAALGTDGFPSDMFRECMLGFFRNRESAHRVEFTRLPGMLCAGHALVSGFFGTGSGVLVPGSPADLVVLDYRPPTPLVKGNLAGHLLFGMHSGMVRHVMVDGAWRVWNREVAGMNEERVMHQAARAAARLWRRMRSA